MPSTTFFAVVLKRGKTSKKLSGIIALINLETQIEHERRLDMEETGRTPYGQKSRANYGTAESRHVSANEKQKAIKGYNC
jgi:hypothetical protein